MSISIENYENKVIRIKSKYNGSYLMVKNSNVKNHTNVGVGRLSYYDNSQKWIIKKKSNKYIIASFKNPNFELDYHTGTYGTYGNYGNCTVFQHIEDSDFNDAKIEFSGTYNKCRIKNKGNGTFLHTLYSESNSNVEWKNYEYRSNQIWEIENVNDSSFKELDLKYNNIHQRYSGTINDSKFSEINDPMYTWGCSRCSVACILSNISGSEIDPRKIPTDSNYYVNFTNIPYCKIIYQDIEFIELSKREASKKEQLNAIKNSIDRNSPVIIRLACGHSTHFIVAYAYKNYGQKIEDILTFDTIYPNDSNGYYKYGEKNNLKRSMQLNFNYKYTEIKGVFTYRKK